MGKCDFDKDMLKLYIYNGCIFSYQLFYFLSYFCQNIMLNFSLEALIIHADHISKRVPYLAVATHFTIL